MSLVVYFLVGYVGKKSEILFSFIFRWIMCDKNMYTNFLESSFSKKTFEMEPLSWKVRVTPPEGSG